MGMHASFTISDETMALCNELKPEGVGSVSYTHLDVYKRQRIYFMKQWIRKMYESSVIRYIFFGGCTTMVNLVSFFIDVYKRQGIP